MSGCLAAGAGAVASFQTAGRLWGLDGMPRRPAEEIHISVPRPMCPAPWGNTKIHRPRNLGPKDVASRLGIPVTNLPRTLIDLGSVLEPRDLESALESALRKRDSLLGWLSDRLRRLGKRGREGAGGLNALVRRHLHGASVLDSALEVRVRQLLTSLGVGTPRTHHDIVDGKHHVANVDFAFPKPKVAIQAMGERVHRQRGRWLRDLQQISHLTSLGWSVICVSWEDLELRREAVGARVLQALERGRGGTPPPKRP